MLYNDAIGVAYSEKSYRNNTYLTSGVWVKYVTA